MKWWLTLLVLFPLLASCVPAQPVILPTETATPTAPPPTATSTPSPTLTPTPTPTPTPTVTATPTPQPTPMGGGIPLLAFNGKTGDTYQLYVANLYQGEPDLTGQHVWPGRGLVWSHSGRYLVIVSVDDQLTGSLFLYDRMNGAVKKLIKAETKLSFSKISWSFDDEWLAFRMGTSYGQIYTSNYYTYSIAQGKLYKFADKVSLIKWCKDRQEVVYLDGGEYWRSDPEGLKKEIVVFSTAMLDLKRTSYRGTYEPELDGFILNIGLFLKQNNRLQFIPLEKGTPWELSVPAGLFPTPYFFGEHWLSFRYEDRDKGGKILIDLLSKQTYTISPASDNENFFGILGVSPDGRLVVYHNRIKQNNVNQIVIQEIATGRRVLTWDFPKGIIPIMMSDDSAQTYIGQLLWVRPGE